MPEASNTVTLPGRNVVVPNSLSACAAFMCRCVVSARRWALLIPLSFLAACMGTTSPPAMLDGNLTAPPAGWLDFCKRNADDPYCRPLSLTSKRMDELMRVQRELAAVARV